MDTKFSPPPAHEVLPENLYLWRILDAIPSVVLIMDREARVFDANKAGRELLGDKPGTVLRRLCGDVLHCVHARSTVEGCGKTEFCPDCVVRKSLVAALDTHAPVNRRAEMLRDQEGESELIHFMVTASPLEYLDLAVLVLEDISELMRLRRIIPICASCKKVRNDQSFWENVDEYLLRVTNLEFSHGLCPDCMKTLYPNVGQKKSEN